LTRPDERDAALVPRPHRLRSAFWLIALIGLVVLVVAACGPADGPGASGSPGASPSTLPPAAIPLVPAQPGADPISLLAWLFTPIFQSLFIALVLIDQVVGNMLFAIILLTLLLRTILIPIYRRQLVSSRRMQLLAPEIREIQKRNKGDRAKAAAAQQELYRERGVNPVSGCLPLILTLFLLIPMYSVFSQGLTNYDPQAMMDVFGIQIVDLNCPATPMYESDGHVVPCLNATAFGIDWGRPLTLFDIPILPGIVFGFSLLALTSAAVQFVQSRMMLPKTDPSAADDPNVKMQRQLMLFLPLISIAYGGFLPAGLFVYWIVSTIFAIIQQYLIVGWGSMFPFLGWSPGFAEDHTPRFPVSMPEPKPASRSPTSALGGDMERKTSAERTIRRRGRSSRRGRRR
jgi:YidC/Oxa1 family membrane protein insertase